ELEPHHRSANGTVVKEGRAGPGDRSGWTVATARDQLFEGTPAPDTAGGIQDRNPPRTLSAEGMAPPAAAHAAAREQHLDQRTEHGPHGNGDHRHPRASEGARCGKG